MSTRLPLITGAALTVLALLILAAPARGDGGPMVGMDAGYTGVTNPSSDSRYVAMLTGGGSTVARIAKRGGQVERYVRLRQPLTFPSIAVDMGAAGLSADGSTLAMALPSYGSGKHSVFGILDARSLRLRKVVKLPGYLTLDGISADGRDLYLVKYAGRNFSYHYELRSFDLRSGRLDPEPIVDPRNPSEKMTGTALTRTTSPDGIWDYTLYDGDEDFVHALNTGTGHAYCIDLDDLPPKLNPSQLHLHVSPDGNTLTVAGRQEALAEVDTHSLEVSEPGTSGGGGIPGGLVATFAALLALAAALGIRRRARGRRGTGPVPPPTVPAPD